MIKEVNKISLEKQKKQLEEINPEFLTKEKKEEERVLPELPNANLFGKKVDQKQIVMRMAPNPNGPLHIGHCRMAILNDEYAKKYSGSLFLRFDDTDPKNENKIPMKEAYGWIEEDLKWLGVKYDRVERASSRLEVYYSYFKQFLEKGFTYVCLCEQESWSKLVREQRKECPCRKFTNQGNLKNWEKMLSGKFKEGQAVGRIKSNFEKEKNPAVLDWVAFRIVDNPQHPFSKNKVWPTLDFASAIDDKDFGATHIVRGKDLASSEEKQRILYDYLGWKYPVTKVYGKFMTSEDLVISKSKIQEGIKSGLYTGYDDPKLVFLRALKRRGIKAEAIRNYILNLGLSESETTVDLEILFSENKKLVDKEAGRYMVVLDPVKINTEELTQDTFSEPVHPENKEKKKKITVSKEAYIAKEDFEKYNGKEVRLLPLFNVKVGKKVKLLEDQNYTQKQDKIQWAPYPGIKVKVIFPEGTKEGFGEQALADLKEGEIIQMIRIGFGVIEKKAKDLITIIFSHK